MLDLLGTIASLLSTYLFIRLHKAAWLVSLVAILINGWLYWQKGIYADMVLEMLYFLSICYGWLQWQKPRPENSSDVKTLTFSQWCFIPLLVGSLFLAIVYLLHRYTATTVANLDALTTSLSLVAQWLMCHKFIATWMLWLITDTIYAYLYLIKQLPFHTLLMMTYTGMALAGYWVWRRQLNNQSQTNPKTIALETI